jgi:hypothetical protein
MERISRYFLVLAAILGFAIILPKLYWMAFSKPVHAPFLMYSCIEDDFMIRRNINGNTWWDSKGNKYTRDEFEKRLPFLYVRQLIMSDEMPDSIKGVEMNLQEINISNSNFRSTPANFNSPKPNLFPLFESQSGRATLELPADFFRITWRMEFVDAATNKILEEKSQMFSAVLYKRGFKFPAKSINGIPTTRKTCDEGYIVTDSDDQLFHIKMVEGEPFVVKVELPDGLKFKQINCIDFRDKQYYAYLFSTENELYILTQDDYILIKWPVADANPEKYQMRLAGDLFNYTFIADDENSIRAIVLDKEFNKITEYNESWPGRFERIEGKIFQALFPGQISLTDKNSRYIKFYTSINLSFYWLITSFILFVIQYIVIRKRKSVLKNNLADLALIVLTGIFGFLAVNIFSNKFFS